MKLQKRVRKPGATITGFRTNCRKPVGTTITLVKGYDDESPFKPLKVKE